MKLHVLRVGIDWAAFPRKMRFNILPPLIDMINRVRILSGSVVVKPFDLLTLSVLLSRFMRWSYGLPVESLARLMRFFGGGCSWARITSG